MESVSYFFTLLVRLIISPLSLTQLRSAKAMAVRSPLIKELQNIYGKDREHLTKATMALYQEHKINLVAGCLPLVIQLPVLWALFNVFTALSNTCYPLKECSVIAQSIGATNIFHSAFLWLPNLGHADPIHLLPILAGIMQ